MYDTSVGSYIVNSTKLLLTQVYEIDVFIVLAMLARY